MTICKAAMIFSKRLELARKVDEKIDSTPKMDRSTLNIITAIQMLGYSIAKKEGESNGK